MTTTSSKVLWTGVFILIGLPEVPDLSIPTAGVIGVIVLGIGVLMHWMNR